MSSTYEVQTSHHSLAPKRMSIYGATLLFVVALGVWLVFDVMRERERALASASKLAGLQSQALGRAFADTFLSTDYVLRDVLGRVNLSTDAVYPDPRPAHAEHLQRLLKEKLSTVPVLEDLVLFDRQCVFTSVAMHRFEGRRSQQRFCEDLKVQPGQNLHLQYQPPSRSKSRRPVILMTRTEGSPDGRLLGGATAVVDLEYVQRWLKNFDLGENDVLAVTDREGTLLGRNPSWPDAIGQQAPHFVSNVPFSSLSSLLTLVGDSPWDGRRRVFAANPLERFPLVIIVGFDTENVLRAWRWRAWQLGCAYGVLLLLTVLILRAHLTMVEQRNLLHRLATTDALTDLPNRRQVVQTGEREVDRARRSGQPMAVLMMDIDRFKAINDRWGHYVGDGVIREVGRIVQSTIRPQDTGGRFGGEEFCIILTHVDMEGALSIAERLRLTVEDDTTILAGGEPLRFTVSIGVASLQSEDENFEALWQRSDKALYLAKGNGRNRVECAMPAENVTN